MEEYALLMLDNMQEKKHFVIGKIVGFVNTKEEQNDYAIYKDLLTENNIYPSSYEANEFIDSEEYIKELKSLKWISRKIINKEEALTLLKEMDKDVIFDYGFNVFISKERKINKYDKELRKHSDKMKKIRQKKRSRD